MKNRNSIPVFQYPVPLHACRHFSALDGIDGYERGFGAVICQTERPYLLASDVQAQPVRMI